VTPKIEVKRVYEPPIPEDGRRVLVERLWPRGVRKDSLAMDLWAKDLGASETLRQWYGHVPQRWPEFRPPNPLPLQNRIRAGEARSSARCFTYMRLHENVRT